MPGAGEKLSNLMINEGKKTFWLIFFFAANFVLFFMTYARYKDSMSYDTLKEGVTFARGAAATLNLNCGLLIIPLCRHFLTKIRGTFLGNLFPLDEHIEFHKLLAWMTAAGVSVHALAHYVNMLRLGSLDHKMATLFAYTTIAGSTGHIITFCMVMMYTAALERVRHNCFELFWYSHHLFIIFFGLLLCHGNEARLQPNQFWAWFGLGGILYMIERLTRMIKGNYKTHVARLVQHPAKVVELQLQRGGFKYKSGMYLFINCPAVSRYEWHPFTITSAPEEDYVSIHVRMVGDWTNQVANLLGLRWTKSGEVEDHFGPAVQAVQGTHLFRIDGPFGAASDTVFDYPVAVLVGAGIGVTPFASILKSIWYRVMDVGRMKLKKAYFIWTCRDREAFAWFADLLAALECENLDGFLDTRVFLTAKIQIEEVREIMYHEEAGCMDAITGLQAPTYFGRPNWDGIYREMMYNHPGMEIGVFLCGPVAIAKILHKLANKYSRKDGTRFIFNKENF